MILALTPSLVRAVGEHIKFNKTTERKSSQRKTSSFYEKRRSDFNQKVENDSQITIHLTLIKNADFWHFYKLELQIFKLISQKNKKASTFADAFSYYAISNYPKNEIKIPAATAEPITPDTLDDIQ